MRDEVEPGSNCTLSEQPEQPDQWDASDSGKRGVIRYIDLTGCAAGPAGCALQPT
jgi:hypothetical protein